MRRVILIMSGLLLTTMLQAQAWQIRSWQKYLIDEQVKQDTAIICQSVMGLPYTSKPFDTRLYRTVTGSEMISNLPPYKKKSKSFFGYNDSAPSLFEEQRDQERVEKMARGEYHFSDFVFDTLLDVVNSFLVKDN
ncbi:hypothetical protein J5A58_07650 [Prevotella melaninogenica]|uniref:DUF4858 domain-containing protein n=2 Tax=Prevotellaceae TaxID=171552 RepID=A0ABX7XP46_9BACT|nr:hypothetical protein J5A58_07650 [Prevotella melaninogenica]